MSHKTWQPFFVLSKFNRSGFTLLELLVVVAIIGLLATLSILALNNARMLARDARRKADLRQIRTALEMYYDVNDKYPRAGGCSYGTNCYIYSTNAGNWFAALSPYLAKAPRDPINNIAGPWYDGQYSYIYGNVSADGQIFDLAAQLENKNDPDRCEIKKYILNWTKGVWCGIYSKQLYTNTP